MSKVRKTIRIPSVTLRLLIGECNIDAGPFARSRMEQLWPCGCLADYVYDNGDTLQWTPCKVHEALLPESA